MNTTTNLALGHIRRGMLAAAILGSFALYGCDHDHHDHDDGGYEHRDDHGLNHDADHNDGDHHDVNRDHD